MNQKPEDPEMQKIGGWMGNNDMSVKFKGILIGDDDNDSLKTVMSNFGVDYDFYRSSKCIGCFDLCHGDK